MLSNSSLKGSSALSKIITKKLKEQDTPFFSFQVFYFLKTRNFKKSLNIFLSSHHHFLPISSLESGHWVRVMTLVSICARHSH